MLKLLACAIGLAALIAASTAAEAGADRAANRARKSELCHQKIDPKGLAGSALKAEWQKYKENPDAY